VLWFWHISSTNNDRLSEAIQEWKSASDYATSSIDPLKARLDYVCILFDLPN
jgi:hypothetical protein